MSLRTSRFLSSYLVDALHAASLSSVRPLDTEKALDPAADAAEAWAAVGVAYDLPGRDLVNHLARYLKLESADLRNIPDHVLALVPDEIARKYQVVPTREENRRLVVATCDPTNLEAEKEISFACGRDVEFAVASPDDLTAAIELHYSADRAVETALGRIDDTEDFSVEIIEDLEPEAVAAEEAHAQPVIKLTNLILREAIEAKASDIHIEAHRTGGLVRFRVDGVLRQYMQLPLVALMRVVSRLKIMAKLDIADRLRPQDGRARVQMFGRPFDLRVSTLPTRHGEKVVLRLLDPENIVDLNELGMTGIESERFHTLLGYRNGLVLVTGPTGSGKTTTLYAGISRIATSEINVMTVEDPVEYDLSGVNQIQVEQKQNLTFAAALRSVLRQDPDIIFVGEIRDSETAAIAVQGCMTGHLVLATLHTNDAVGVIRRLNELGVDNPSLSATLRGAIAQRLLRRVCPDCVAPIEDDLTEREVAWAERHDVTPTVRAIGCKKCGGTGYRGRLPVTEVLVASEELARLIQEGASDADLLAAARRSGMRLMSESVRDSIADGLTTIDEVDRVLGEGPTPASGAARDEGTEILLVEDDPVTRKIATRLLLREGFRVVEAADGREALRALARHPTFSLVITDLNMPHLGGREVLADIRGTVATATLPVIVLTAESGEATEVELMRDGADDYIRKPIEPEGFIARIKGVLRRTSID